ncbi:MAG: Maf family nucleotide pyrophosphatase, partial [Muribaculaceae bacterium]|nr:Maf family nucleotide pyrophosphatase [Muribaculaceae bacterium]
MHPLHNLANYKIILGSNSPRRKQLLEQIGINFTVDVPTGVEESYPHDTPAEEIPVFLSKLKAKAYTDTHAMQHTLLITADTVVIAGSKVLGKPHTPDEAQHMLQTLSGNTHIVTTGVTITTEQKTISFGVSTTVQFATLTPDEINYYIEKYRPFDKAGAYGIQEWIGCIGVERINGSFYNVM